MLCSSVSVMLNDPRDSMFPYSVFLDVCSYDLVPPRHLLQKTGERTIWQFLREITNENIYYFLFQLIACIMGTD